MVAWNKKRINQKEYCISDLDKRITIYSRSILAPSTGSSDYEENFDVKTKVFAAVITKTGKTIFDDSNIERNVTHEIIIRYIDGITVEAWIDINDKRFDLIRVENINEKNRWLKLSCSKRGLNTSKTNFA